MATACGHLSVEELEERYVGCEDATASRHFQVIWLLARGHTISQVAQMTAFGERWIEQLLARYNAEGPEALGDLRRRNGTPATIFKPELLAKLRDRLRKPHRLMADCGRAVRWHTGWRSNSASNRSRRNVARKR
jgi:transposase